MYRNHFLFISVTLGLSVLLAGCGTPPTASSLVKILPDDCKLKAGEQIPLALDGIIPPNATIQWESSDGSIVFTPPGLNALFTAPLSPTIMTVSVSISSGTPGVNVPITRQCTVMPADNAAIPVISLDTEIVQTHPTGFTVIISEVMAYPCGSVNFKQWNQYVELYNNGDQPVDVRGLWLSDGGDVGTPDMLVAWADRQPRLSPADNTVTNTTIIQPHSFAVVLSPIYTEGENPYHMPYLFPAGTVILTIASSNSLGDDYFGILGDGDTRDPLALYMGSASVADSVISTYGTPILSTYVREIRDDHLDNIPLDLHACGSAERSDPNGRDAFENWHEVPSGSPGDAPY